MGGEPFEPENQEPLLNLLKRIKVELPSKDIWCYSGFLYDTQLISGKVGQFAKEILGYIDVLVDGRFVDELKSPDLLFRGSSNQRIIDVQQSLLKQEVVCYEKYMSTNEERLY